MDDAEAYLAYPELRYLFNKLSLSESLGHQCGPGGISPNVSDWFVVRPIINLRGMGLGAEKMWIDKGDLTKVKPGYFWAEWFSGAHYSVSYQVVDGHAIQTSCFRGYNIESELSTFTRWERSNETDFVIPDFLLRDLIQVPTFNVEFIGDKIIEVHLRDSPDPQRDWFVPMWEGQQQTIDKYVQMGYNYIHALESADGFLKKPRLGFIVSNT